MESDGDAYSIGGDSSPRLRGSIDTASDPIEDADCENSAAMKKSAVRNSATRKKNAPMAGQVPGAYSNAPGTPSIRHGQGQLSRSNRPSDNYGVPSDNSLVSTSVLEGANLSTSCTATNNHGAGIATTRQGENIEDEEEHDYRYSTTRGDNADFVMSARQLVEATVVDDEAVVQPSIVVTAVEVGDPIRPFRKYLYLMVGGGCLLLALVIGITVVFAIPDNESGNPQSLPLTEEERFDIFQEQLEDLVYDKANLDDTSSPQRKALDWIASKDPMRIDPRSGDYNVDKVEEMRQRFLAALFYFTTTENNGRWKYCYPPQTGENDACVHNVLESYPIEGVYYPQRMSEPSFRWMTQLDVCRWAGIICSDVSHISHITLGK
jgi:hypothetical protein